MTRLIDADELMEWVTNWLKMDHYYHQDEKRDDIPISELEDIIERMPTVDAIPQWIPVKFRPMDSEEREYWEEQFGEKLADEDAVMFDCPMPEDGQEILVSYRKWICMDKCEIDGGCYGLEGNGDWEDIIAWMQLPTPYERKEE